MAAAAPGRRGAYWKTVNGVAFQEVCSVITDLISKPAPQGRPAFTFQEIKALALARLTRKHGTVTPGVPWVLPTIRWDWVERYFRDQMHTDFIPVAEYYFSNLKKKGQSRAYDILMGEPMSTVAFRSISCCPPISCTVGFLVNSGIVHPIDSEFPLTWLEWRKAVGSGHIRSAMDRLDRSVANRALTQSEANLVLDRVNFTPLRAMLK
jgi:hypothetical protein